MAGIFEKLKSRWEVEKPWHVWVILAVFAATGMTLVRVKKPVYEWIGIDDATPLWLRILAFLFIAMPIYQVILLTYGTLAGQFKFFWKFEQRMFGRMFGWALPKKEEKDDEK